MTENSGPSDSNIATKFFLGKSRPSKTIIISVVVFSVFILFGYLELRDRLSHVFEIDARVHAKLITVSSRVAGWVTHMGARQGEFVSIGSVLTKIDSRDASLITSELEAQLEGIRAQKQRIKAKSRLVFEQNKSRLDSEQSKQDAAQVIVSSLKPKLSLANRQLLRIKTLFKQKVASQRQLDQTDSQLQEVEREHKIAAANLRAAKAKVRQAIAERAQLDILTADIAVLTNKEAELKIKIDRNTLDLEDRIIRSLVNGVVDKTFVEVGEYVRPGQRLLLVHDPNDIWIEANIKETEVRRLKVGQRVEILVDAYPEEMFEGVIETIGNAATSEFALLPSSNPSGNFTKITQRLPVRIAITQRDRRLRPGMMTEIKIATNL